MIAVIISGFITMKYPTFKMKLKEAGTHSEKRKTDVRAAE